MSTRTVSRRELYELVWERPMLQLARTHGLSDVGLAKICRKHGIPRPPRGYWAKKQNGQRPKQIPLADPDREERILLPEARAGTSQDPDRERVVRPTVQVDIAESLRGAHPLVGQVKAELQAAEVSDYGILAVPEGAALRVEVSKVSLRRALLIMDAVLRAIEAAGHAVSRGPRATVDGATVGFEISEQLETKRTPIEDHDLSGRYTFGHSQFKETRVPTGRLALRIVVGGYWRHGFQRTWRDTEKRRLEERLGGFVAGLIEVADRVKQRQEQQRVEAERRRQEELRRQEEARRRAENLQLQKAEQAKVDQLLRDAADWNAARRLREYIRAVQATSAAEEQSRTDPEVVAWLEWAMQQADRLDPLQPSPPSILDEDLGPDDPPNSLPRGW